jgi:propionyl-CoA carboxylase alpha chain
VQALREVEIHGVTTNRNHLIAVLESDDFRAGVTTTAFVDLHLTLLDARLDQATVDAHLLAATLWAQHERRTSDPHWRHAPSGWRNVGTTRQEVRYARSDGGEATVTYTAEPTGAFLASIDERTFRGTWHARDDHDRAVLLEIDGVTAVYWVNRVDDTWYVNSSMGQSELVELPRFPDRTADATAGGLAAPVPGRIIAVDVSIGDAVVAGQTLVVMEAMKVEHRVLAPADGKVVDVFVATGDNVDAHEVLVQIEAST